MFLAINMCTCARIFLNGVKTKGNADIIKTPDISIAGEIGKITK